MTRVILMDCFKIKAALRVFILLFIMSHEDAVTCDEHANTFSAGSLKIKAVILLFIMRTPWRVTSMRIHCSLQDLLFNGLRYIIFALVYCTVVTCNVYDRIDIIFDFPFVNKDSSLKERTNFTPQIRQEITRKMTASSGVSSIEKRSIVTASSGPGSVCSHCYL